MVRTFQLTKTFRRLSVIENMKLGAKDQRRRARLRGAVPFDLAQAGARDRPRGPTSSSPASSSTTCARLRREPVRRPAQAARDGPTLMADPAGDARRADGRRKPGADAVAAGPRQGRWGVSPAATCVSTGVDPGRRLVEHHHLGVDHQRPGLARGACAWPPLRLPASSPSRLVSSLKRADRSSACWVRSPSSCVPQNQLEQHPEAFLAALPFRARRMFCTRKALWSAGTCGPCPAARPGGRQAPVSNLPVEPTSAPLWAGRNQ